MTRIEINSAKLNVVFPAGKLPVIDPADPSFTLALGGLVVRGRVNARAARKLAVHDGGAVLQGRLVVAGGGGVELADAGFSWIEAKAPVEAAGDEAGPAGP